MKSILYHGSPNIIEVPQFGKGNPNNDYGLGFYCTENLDLAKEWASSSATDGFANEYELNWKGLTVCDLGKGHNILNWMAILVENRTFDLTNAVAESAREYLLENFLPKYKEADIVRGYRADDSYFTFAKDFLNNSIPLETLSEAMRLGKLGEQIVLRSQKAFDALAVGRTTLIIAHRLSTIRSAHRIVSIADGYITECGTHQELLQQDGIYASLYKTQNAMALEGK